MGVIQECLYDELKAGMKKRYTGLTYDDFLTNVVTSMIKLKNKEKISPNFDDYFIEEYCSYDGCCAIWNLDGEWVITRCAFSGDRDANGIGRDVICTTENAHTETFEDWRNNPNVVVIFNNNSKSPDFLITRTSNFLTEIDTSLRILIQNTRLSNLFKIRTPKEKKQLEEAILAIKDGAPAIVQLDASLSDIIEGDESSVSVENLTDPSLSDKIQYLVKGYDDILRQFYSVYGMKESGGAKLAQQSTEEINDGSNICSIIPLSKLEARNEAIEKLRALTGVPDLEFVFSTAWQREEQKKSDDLEGTEELEDNIVGNEEEGEHEDVAEEDREDDPEKDMETE